VVDAYGQIQAPDAETDGGPDEVPDAETDGGPDEVPELEPVALSVVVPELEPVALSVVVPDDCADPVRSLYRLSHGVVSIRIQPIQLSSVFGRLEHPDPQLRGGC
jgi:hypothetical protein